MRRMQNRIPPVVIIYKRDGERMRDRADGCRGWTGCQTEQLPFRKRWKGVGYVCFGVYLYCDEDENAMRAEQGSFFV